MLTLLHTSDWHLGRRLYGKPRYTEFKQFLDWQLQVIDEQQVDILLIAGDIFDTTSPSNQAQNLYFDFLSQVFQTNCRHVIVVAGNHDSASFLDAPKQLLKFFNIHIVGSMTDDPQDEVITLTDENGNPELIVMAVPYLRDRDVRTIGSGECLDDKERKLAQGIQAHYQAITDIALQRQAIIQQQHGISVPIVATGHLFTVGGKTTQDDGVRELYVGSLGSIGAEIFHEKIDYVALGHLHIPQVVGGQARIRYSGSPIAMGFGESEQQKQVHLVRFNVDDSLAKQPFFDLVSKNSSSNSTPLSSNVKKSNPKQTASFDLFADESDNELGDTIFNSTKNPVSLAKPYNLVMLNDTTLLQSLAVPTFQRLQTVRGDWQSIKSTLQALKKSGEIVWLEVVYDSDTVMGDFKEQVSALVKDTALEIIRLPNLQAKNKVLQAQCVGETLEELNEQQVFERCLVSYNVTDEQKPVMWARYAQVLESLKGE